MRPVVILRTTKNFNYGDENESTAGNENSRKPNTIMNNLPNNYLCEGSLDKMMCDALKEQNIDGSRDFFKEEEPSNFKTFEKEKTALPPQYHLESSWGKVKDRLTAFQLHSYFRGCHLKDFSLSSKLGTGISVVDDD